MKNSIIISLAALGSLAAAASEAPCLSLTTKFPRCVLSCAQEAATKAGCANTADLECQCNPKSSSAIQSLALGCASACSTELLPGISAGSALCACVASHAAATTSETGTETTGTETTGTETTATRTPHTGALTSGITKTETLTGTKTGSASEKTTTTGTKTETSTTTGATTTGATTTSPTTATQTTTTSGAGIFQVSFAVVAGAILVAAVAL
ncbi:hypothetical protein MGU_06411 [Metarhizium guizhouense ARSEF 977]|uniref:CFEM domain-containing protein n=1 Tax=Metarhizium guizhouense (strain ARSEF 977) TaxID=1276136 RepID=A0A0B4I297_METGA|nr:hypothetical protein MGU_06411 [Metarhizium guizhouense ARSEF 977]